MDREEHERRYSRLSLPRKGLVHSDWVEGGVHTLAEHVDNINAGVGVVAVIVAALACRIVAGTSTVGTTAGTAATVGARIRHLGRRHGDDAGDGVVISGSFGGHGDRESLVRSGVGGVVSGSCCGHFG
jgi:hypothetical protein